MRGEGVRSVMGEGQEGMQGVMGEESVRSEESVRCEGVRRRERYMYNR